MPLSMINIGEKVTIKYLALEHNLKKRLEAMGLLPGTELIIISNNLNGSFIVKVKGSKLILGKSVTNKIYVNVIL